MKKYYIDLRFVSEGSFEGEALEKLEKKLPDNLVYFLNKIKEKKEIRTFRNLCISIDILSKRLFA